jgi:hypothetical protein
MDLVMFRAILIITALLSVAACSDPCRDYCEVFVDRSQECDLGGPSGDDVVEECGDDVSETLTNDACDNANENISAMSCSEFSSLVCSTPNADATYNCPGGS